MQLNLKQLEAFVWVADLGSFRKAADRLNTTQPNISARITNLEVTLKTSLMERDAGSVRLTSKGEQLLGHARRILRATEDMIEASGQSALMDGTLRLGVTEMIVHTWLQEFLRALKDRFPNVSVELTFDLSVNLERDLFDRTIDLALQNGPFQRQITGSHELGTYRSIWVASPTLGFSQSGLVSMDDLLQHPVLTHARDTRLFEEMSAHFAGRRAQPARLVPSNNLAACIHMAVNGMGVACIPAAMVYGELERGALVEVKYEWSPESLQFFARYDAGKTSIFVAQSAAIAAEIAQKYTAVL